MGRESHSVATGALPRQESSPPTSAMVVRLGFLINAAIWTLFGVLGVARIAGGFADRPTTEGVVAILMFVNAGVMLLIGWGLGSRRKLFYYLGIAYLAVNIVLTVTDEFGVVDLVTLLFDVLLLALLVWTRAWYEPSPAERAG